MLTTAEAADRLGIHPNNLRRWILTGRLRATKVADRVYVIDEADFEAFAEWWRGQDFGRFGPRRE